MGVRHKASVAITFCCFPDFPSRIDQRLLTAILTLTRFMHCTASSDPMKFIGLSLHDFQHGRWIGARRGARWQTEGAKEGGVFNIRSVAFTSPTWVEDMVWKCLERRRLNVSFRYLVNVPCPLLVSESLLRNIQKTIVLTINIMVDEGSCRWLLIQKKVLDCTYSTKLSNLIMIWGIIIVFGNEIELCYTTD